MPKKLKTVQKINSFTLIKEKEKRLKDGKTETEEERKGEGETGREERRERDIMDAKQQENKFLKVWFRSHLMAVSGCIIILHG